MLKDYYELKENNEKRSNEWFSKKYKLSIMTVGRLIRRVGLKPMIRQNNKLKVKTPESKKQEIERARNTELNYFDIAYFLNVPQYIVCRYYQVNHKNMEVDLRIKEPLKRFGRGKSLTYRTASEIYCLRDVGFKREEIIEGQKLDSILYDYAIKHENEISSHIIKSLKIIYPEKKN